MSLSDIVKGIDRLISKHTTDFESKQQCFERVQDSCILWNESPTYLDHPTYVVEVCYYNDEDYLFKFMFLFASVWLRKFFNYNEQFHFKGLMTKNDQNQDDYLSFMLFNDHAPAWNKRLIFKQIAKQMRQHINLLYMSDVNRKTSIHLSIKDKIENSDHMLSFMHPIAFFCTLGIPIATPAGDNINAPIIQNTYQQLGYESWNLMKKDLLDHGLSDNFLNRIKNRSVNKKTDMSYKISKNGYESNKKGKGGGMFGWLFGG